jgi:hypothetical protein
MARKRRASLQPHTDHTHTCIYECLPLPDHKNGHDVAPLRVLVTCRRIPSFSSVWRVICVCYQPVEQRGGHADDARVLAVP